MKKVKLKGREAIGTSQGLTKSFRALLYADDTLLCEDSEGAMQALLWAVEDVSGVFGLNLNKGKCQQISTGVTKTIRFKDRTKVTKVEVAEYLGGLLHCQAKQKPEVQKRIATASYTRHKLGQFWKNQRSAEGKRS